jgi:hypothetical protein
MSSSSFSLMLRFVARGLIARQSDLCAPVSMPRARANAKMVDELVSRQDFLQSLRDERCLPSMRL